MSERHKPHNGRDLDGHFTVREADVDDLQTELNGAEVIRDDIRLGGAVADIGPEAGKHGAHVAELIQENRENIERTIHPVRPR